MSRQVIFPPSATNCPQPFLENQSRTRRTRIAEVAVGTTADCAAVCCCCPCGLMNLLVLVVYTLPASLCRRVLKKKRQITMKRTGLLAQQSMCNCRDETEFQKHPVSLEMLPIEDSFSSKEAIELEKEMWDRFYSTGFWRSPSQREQ